MCSCGEISDEVKAITAEELKRCFRCASRKDVVVMRVDGQPPNALCSECYSQLYVFMTLCCSQKKSFLEASVFKEDEDYLSAAARAGKWRCGGKPVLSKKGK